MRPLPNVEIVQHLYDAFISRDIDTVLRLLDPAVEWGQPEVLPWGRLYRGPQQVLDFFGKVNEHVDGLRVDVEEYVAVNATVAALGWVSGVARRTRAPFRVRLAHVWNGGDGKVVWFYNYVDTAALLAAIGPGRARSS